MTTRAHVGSKLISIMAILALAIGLIPLPAFAAAADGRGDGLADETPLVAAGQALAVGAEKASTGGRADASDPGLVKRFDFESDGDLEGWTFQDADGDGKNWEFKKAEFYSGGGMLSLRSSGNNVDNWAVAPAIALPGQVSGQSLALSFEAWKAWTTNANYKETLEVYAGTSPTELTIISGNDPIALTESITRYTMDLNSYSGQTIYIAFRHRVQGYGFYSCIDNIEVRQGTQYNLRVAGTQVTSWNAGDLSVIPGVEVAEGGSATYNPNSNVLSLKNTTITYSGTGNEGYGIYYNDYTRFRIEIDGTCAIVDNGSWRWVSAGIRVGHDGLEMNSAYLTINGGASLAITAGGSQSQSLGECYGILHWNKQYEMTIYNYGTLTVTSGKAGNSGGICSLGTLYFYGTGVADIAGGEATDESYGVRATSNIYFRGSTVNASAATVSSDQGESYGIYHDGYTLQFRGGSVTAWTTAESGQSFSALNEPFRSSLDDGHVAFGSTSINKENPAEPVDPVTYVKADNAGYRWFKAAPAITISAADGTWTYDGAAHSSAGVAVTSGELVQGDELVATAKGSATNVADTSAGNNSVEAGCRCARCAMPAARSTPASCAATPST